MDVQIYTKNGFCHYCELAKTRLKRAGLEYHELVVTKDVTRAEFLAIVPNGQAPTFPQVVINGELVGGSDALNVWLASAGYPG